MEKIKIGKILKFILLGAIIAFALAIIPHGKNGHWFFWQWPWPWSWAFWYVVIFLILLAAVLCAIHIVKNLNKEELPAPYPEE